jgi:DNA-binding response OmpR family regulator
MQERVGGIKPCVIVPPESAVVQWLRDAEVPVRATDEAGARRLLGRQQLGVLVIDARLEPAETVKGLLEEAHQRQLPSLLVLARPREAIQLDPEGRTRDFVSGEACAAELLVRLSRIATRRSSGETQSLAAGPLAIDTENFRVTLDGLPITLTLKEFELLRYMADNQQRVVRREELLRQVWGYNYFGGARTVDVHIRRLRSKLEDGERRFIETVRQIGYVFRWNGV